MRQPLVIISLFFIFSLTNLNLIKAKNAIDLKKTKETKVNSQTQVKNKSIQTVRTPSSKVIKKKLNSSKSTKAKSKTHMQSKAKEKTTVKSKPTVVTPKTILKKVSSSGKRKNKATQKLTTTQTQKTITNPTLILPQKITPANILPVKPTASEIPLNNSSIEQTLNRSVIYVLSDSQRIPALALDNFTILTLLNKLSIEKNPQGSYVIQTNKSTIKAQLYSFSIKSNIAILKTQVDLNSQIKSNQIKIRQPGMSDVLQMGTLHTSTGVKVSKVKITYSSPDLFRYEPIDNNISRTPNSIILFFNYENEIISMNFKNSDSDMSFNNDEPSLLLTKPYMFQNISILDEYSNQIKQQSTSNDNYLRKLNCNPMKMINVAKATECRSSDVTALSENLKINDILIRSYVYNVEIKNPQWIKGNEIIINQVQQNFRELFEITELNNLYCNQKYFVSNSNRMFHITYCINKHKKIPKLSTTYLHLISTKQNTQIVSKQVVATNWDLDSTRNLISELIDKFDMVE